VHALHNIHAALSSDAILVDTQPVSARPAVAANGVTLGTLDMREWLNTIHAVDELTAQTIGAGLYELQHEQHFLMTDTYDTRAECLETVSNWRGTRVSRALARQIAARTSSQLTVQQEVRLRVLGRLG
jgi:hypothetical protein